jgi:hypothetical protein
MTSCLLARLLAHFETSVDIVSIRIEGVNDREVTKTIPTSCWGKLN